ncbi:secretion-associated protein [Burkholderia lata]|uniref:Secretion-associated protein n=2 Tax=Burkholderia lata (strain ATCC 17760 / DSM 23089 / LMG 22485 / NCIMB 9086 / R18194 / 383) TaxID=482957 RepID=A0A6P2RM31_BURL3|nr:secretion-associated protein [Burkholderia lata]
MNGSDDDTDSTCNPKIASLVMKQLRILTGFHAGATLQLAPGRHAVHGGADADIRLMDWKSADVTLDVDASGVVRAITYADMPAGSPEESGNTIAVPAGETVILVDFAPMQFGDTILCIGPDDVMWPSDLDLLSTLLIRPADVERKKHRRYYGALGTCVALGIMVGAAVLLTPAPASEAALRHGPAYRTTRIQEALAAAHMTELQVRTVGNSSVVTGMVSNLSDDQLVKSTLAKIAPTDIVRSYDVAQNAVHSIEDSLGIAGVHVKYLGNGDFAITGAVDSKDAVDKAVTRVRADLDSNIRRLVVQVAENPGRAAPVTGQFSEVVSSDSVQYAQTPDGVKHIYAVEAPADAAPASGATDVTASSVDDATVARSATPPNRMPASPSTSAGSTPPLPTS